MSLYCSACDGMGTHSPKCPLNLSPPSHEPAGETNAGTFVCSKCGNSSAWDERGNWNVFEGQGKCSDPCPYLLATNAAPIGGKLPSMGVQHPDGAAPLSDLCGRLERILEIANGGTVVISNETFRETYAALREMEARRAAAHDAMRTAHDARLQSERRAEVLLDLLVEALTFVDTNPDLHRIGGDELKARISAAISRAAGL